MDVAKVQDRGRKHFDSILRSEEGTATRFHNGITSKVSDTLLHS